MRLITGTIIEIYPDGQKPMARVHMAGPFMCVAVVFLSNAKIGDCILIDFVVAIEKVKLQAEETRHVLGNSR